MNVRTKLRRQARRAFTMLELMMVVIIIGVLAAIATPIYGEYVRKSRFTEATSRMGDLLTAAKAYAIENESDGNPATVNWPSGCGAVGFIGDCTSTPYFTYGIEGTGNTQLTIRATGQGKMANRNVTLIVNGLDDEGRFDFSR